jgi:uncharacterized membrane protein
MKKMIFVIMRKESTTVTGRLVHSLNHLRSVYRLLICVGVALACTVFLLPVRMELLTRMMVGWDIYSFSVLMLIGVTFFTMKADQIRVLARRQDSSRAVVFIVVTIACLTSLAAVLDLLGNKKGWQLNHATESFIYLSGVVFSWMLMHTTFTIKYAHIYYGDHPTDPSQEAGGLVIPGDVRPDYMDFAYFSFVIGMTFQVSDIYITSGHIRKLALLHGLLSFLFNTVIVALTINEVVNLQA